MFGVARKKIKLKRTTKNGYAISIIDAVSEPNLLIPEKMKKLASVARMTELIINIRVVLLQYITAFIDS